MGGGSIFINCFSLKHPEGGGGGSTVIKFFRQYQQELDMINEIFDSQWIIGSYPVNKVMVFQTQQILVWIFIS